jgi:hypothetical protein
MIYKPTHYVLLTPPNDKRRIIAIIDAPGVNDGFNEPGLVDEEYAQIIARTVRKSIIARSKRTKTPYTEDMFRLIRWPTKKK